MTAINSFSGALDALSRNQTLKINHDGDLQKVGLGGKISLAFQRYIQKKTPDQLGTNQKEIAKILVKLYKNETPGGTTDRLSLILQSAGTKGRGFAETIRQLPNLEARQAEIKEAPAFEKNDEDIFGTFTRNNGRAGGVSGSAKPPIDTRTHVPADEIAQAVKALNIKSDPEEVKTPASPPKAKIPNPTVAAPKASVSGPVSAATTGPLPEHLASPEEISQALHGLQSKPAQSAPATQGPSASRLSAAASHGRDLAPVAQAKKSEKPLEPGQVRVEGFAFYTPQGDTVEKQIADVQTRLDKCAQDRHLNPVTGQERKLNKGEKEVEIKFLQGHLDALKAQQGGGSADAGGLIQYGGFAFNPIQGDTLEAQIADLKTRYEFLSDGGHWDPIAKDSRILESGEKEVELKFLKEQARTIFAKEFGASTKDVKVLDLIASLKTGQAAGRQFAVEVLPHLSERLGVQTTAQIFTPTGAFYQKLGAKDRHGDILCPKDTVVSLKGGPVHASYIPFKGLGDPAIATQAHKSETIADFVQLIQEKNVTTIVDLTNNADRGKHKTVDYARDGRHFQSEAKDAPAAGIEKRELKVGNHTTSYLNLTSWIDKSVVSLGDLKNLVGAINQDRQGKSGGITIHCNAGVGRTGTVFAALELNRLAQTGELTASNFSDKVLDVVAEGRKARGHAFVQAPEQLALLFDYAKSLA